MISLVNENGLFGFCKTCTPIVPLYKRDTKDVKKLFSASENKGAHESLKG